MAEPEPEFVGTEVAAAKLAELLARPGMAERIAQIREVPDESWLPDWLR